MDTAEELRLHGAAHYGDRRKIKKYLNAGFDVNGVDFMGLTPIYDVCHAVLGDNPIEATKVLLAAGANPSVRDHDGVVAELGNVRLVKMLIAGGADIDAVVGSETHGTPLDEAVSKGRREMVRFLLDSGCDMEMRDAADGQHPLINACAEGDNGIVDMFLDHGANINVVGLLGSTPLHGAVLKNRLDVVMNLVARGVDVDIPDEAGQCAIYYAAVHGLHEIVKVLIGAGAHVNMKDKDGITPLHAASLNGHRDCVWSLLCAKADPSAISGYGETPIHCATRAGNVEIIEVLLSAGVDNSIEDVRNLSPLFFAAIRGEADAANLLIEAGSDPNRLDPYGRNALFFACNIQIVKLLLDRGALATILDRNGMTPLHVAGLLGRDAGVICALYRAGADPTVLDSEGSAAADCARAQGHEDAAKMLDLLAAKHRSLHPPTPAAAHVNDGESGGV